ncbi:MAG: D-glycero-alpha-D-manno-heptose-1,7-bisphosphate 7-phosphatase [Desulfocucumaceae bacterium]
MNKAVFLDRDGVINRLVFNPNTGQYESPHHVRDLVVNPWVYQSLKSLMRENFLLFLVSNQPSYAKGKTTLENIREIHREMHKQLTCNGILFADYYYCYHHPEGIVPEYSGACDCRKPSPYFLLKAREDYQLDFNKSWMVGDQDTDIMCGKKCGVKTILVENEHSESKRGRGQPDFRAPDLEQAVRIIKKFIGKGD